MQQTPFFNRIKITTKSNLQIALVNPQQANIKKRIEKLKIVDKYIETLPTKHQKILLKQVPFFDNKGIEGGYTSAERIIDAYRDEWKLEKYEGYTTTNNSLTVYEHINKYVLRKGDDLIILNPVEKNFFLTLNK